MTLVDGQWNGPILDNHFHLDRVGRYLDAAADFQRVGGTDLVLVHKPDFDNLPNNVEGVRKAYEDTVAMAEQVRLECDLRVRVVLGPHPASWVHQCASLGVEESNELHLQAVELAIEFCEENLAVGVGEVGRPHWDVGDEVLDQADEILIEVLSMCKRANVPAQLHLDANGEKTNREIAKICDHVGFPRFGAIHHHADADISKKFTHGLTSSVVVGRDSIKDISDTIWQNEGGFLMETDYMDDPRRPGAVLGPKTVPRRTQALATSLIGRGLDAEAVLSAIHIDLPEALYGEYE